MSVTLENVEILYIPTLSLDRFAIMMISILGLAFFFWFDFL